MLTTRPSPAYYVMKSTGVIQQRDALTFIILDNYFTWNTSLKTVAYCNYLSDDNSSII